jgi:probable HAF family extracellular repeat protein
MAFKANFSNRLLALIMGAVGVLVGTTELRAQNLPQFIPPSVISDNGNTEVMLSADGSTVVGFSFSDVNSGSPDAAWRWKAGTGTVALGAVPGFDSLNLTTGTSSDGSVVVGSGSGSSGVQGFIWTQGGGIVPLGLTSGDVGNMTFAVSADGSTVVGAHWSSSTAGAFSWTQAGGFVNIGTLPGDTGASAFAVSRNGSVIVGSSTNPSGPSEQAFMWTAAGGMVGLGALPGDTGSAAYAVSSDGTTVVGISYGATTPHAFRWTAATGMVNLGVPSSGYAAAVAYATNQDGSVVVGQLSGGTLANAAFIWTAAGGIQAFQDYWLNNGGNLNNGSVSFLSSTGVSDNGKIFLGDGVDPSSGASVFIANTQPSPLLAAVLPASRSAQLGSPVTAFATVINTGTVTGSDCGIALEYRALQLDGINGAFVYQTTNPTTNAVTGTANTPFNIAANNGSQSLVIAFTPSDAFSPVNMPFSFACDTLAPARVVTGLDTLLVSASITPTPDVIALGATPQNDGIVHVTGTPMQGAFAVATDNLGSSSTITVAANTGTVKLPITVTVCQTNAAGACMQTPSATVATTIGSNATPTFGIFVSASNAVPFDPTNNRIFVTFTDSTNTVRGETSVAVETQ